MLHGLGVVGEVAVNRLMDNSSISQTQGGTRPYLEMAVESRSVLYKMRTRLSSNTGNLDFTGCLRPL
jgi:hypothetical protein